MLKFTEKLGKYELIYEGETVQEIINLKQAINPSHLSLKDDSAGCSYAKDNKNIRAQIAYDRMNELPPSEISPLLHQQSGENPLMVKSMLKDNPLLKHPACYSLLRKE